MAEPDHLASAGRLDGRGGVSWSAVEQVAREWLGPAARLDKLSFLTGGVVNTTLALHTRCGARAVLKISAYRVNHAHERERRALEWLATLGLPVPTVYASRTATLESPHSYLLMERVEGVTLRAARDACDDDAWGTLQHELADHAAAIHAVTGDRYGKVEGATFTEWPAFYRSLVEPACDVAERMKCLPVRTRKTIGRLHDRLDELLAHGDVPRLCHGDLWASNILCAPGPDGRWRVTAILDPDLRHAHVEVEIAYLELFKTITPRFKQAYGHHFRLSDHYHRLRKPIYQLYALVNHLHVHGATHATPVIEAAERVATLV